MARKHNTVQQPIPIDVWKSQESGRQTPLTGSPEDTQYSDKRDVQDGSLVKANILIVDPVAASLDDILSTLADIHHELFTASSTDDALLMLAHHPIDLIIVDLNAPEIGGIAFCERIRNAQATRLIPVFVKCFSAGQTMEPQAMKAGADEFLIFPQKPSAFRARVHATLRHKAVMTSLDDAEAILFSLAKSVEDRDPDLGHHCQRIALMAAGIGLVIGLPPVDIRTLHRGGYLHDIGKIGIPDQVLFKAGPLTPEEWEIMKSHAQRGERICAATKSLTPVLPIIRNHHEKFDGTGYPDALKGEQIPLLARIVQVADIYDALTTERPYKRAYTPDEALAIMREETNKGWRDPFLVEVLAELLPAFRNREIVDPATFSLQALAASLEEFRLDRNGLPGKDKNDIAGNLTRI